VRSARSRAMRDGYILGGLAYGAAIVSGLLDTPVDPTIFYNGRLPDPYTQLTYSVLHTGFFYSPAIAQLLEPFRVLPVALFGALWVGGLMVLLYAMLGRRAILGLLFIPVAWEISTGNIHLVFAAVVLLGFRYPALWSIPLLTKVTPGVGLVWFLVRREWRSLAIALGFTGVIVLVSFLLAPDLWSKWVGLIIANRNATGDYPSVPIPLLVRLPIAVLLVTWGARTDRRWTVLIATMISAPVMWWTSLAMLAAFVPLLRKPSEAMWAQSASRLSGAPLPAPSPS
jgi:hypothetical protein